MSGSDNDILYGAGLRVEVSDAQGITIMQATDAVSQVNYAGTPENFVAANPGSICFDRTNGDIYKKATGISTTGWEMLAGGATVPTTFITDSGNATPSTNQLQIVGSHGINTNGTLNIIDVEIDNAILLGDLSALGAGVPALTLTTGDLSILSGNITTPTTADADNGVYEVNDIRFMHSFGSLNTFLGSASGNFTLSGNSNTGIGLNTLTVSTSAVANTAVGTSSSDAITTGGFNTSVGWSSLGSNQTGVSNVAIGQIALNSYTGSQNTAVGAGALTTTITGASCTAVGFQSLLNATGVSNTAIGHDSGGSISSGTFNSCIGEQAFINLTTGDHNVGLGYQSGHSYTTSESSNILIRNTGTIAESNVLHIGTQGSGAGQIDSAFIAGITGVTVASNETSVVIDTATGELGVGTATGIQASSFPTDSGTGVPAAGALTIVGAGDVTTSASGSTITITGTGGVVWTDVTGTSDGLVGNEAFQANNAGLVTLTLPAACTAGDIIEVNGYGAGGWLIAQNASQTIHFLGTDTTTGVGGSLASTNRYDCLTLRCAVTNTDFVVISSNGSITIV